VQHTRKDRVTRPRSWTSLMTNARTLSWSFFMRLALVLAALLADLSASLELALCQMHRQVSKPLLELRAPLIRHLLQVAEPAPRLVPLTLLLELRGQLVLLDRTPL